VGAARRRAASWLEREDRAPGLSFTFQDGLEWIMYEMLDVDKALNQGERFLHAPTVRHYRSPFISMSVFVCSPVSKGLTAMGAHSRVGERLKEQAGFASEVIPTEVPMWLCCRHKQAGSAIGKAQGREERLALRDLAGRFGLDEGRVQSYLDKADDYPYVMVKSLVSKKSPISRRLWKVSHEIEDPTTAVLRLPELLREKERLSTEMSRLEDNLLGDPEGLL